MGQRVFLAGASGVVGRPLIKLLKDDGHHVTGIGRSSGSAEAVRALGADYVAVDVFDADALARAIAAARPDVVIHQLTDLPARLEPSLMARAIERNARVREEGTRNLVQGALAAGVHRMIAQSIAWLYAPGTPPYTEDDPLEKESEAAESPTHRGVVALERLVLGSPPLEGVVLRYGGFYGPDTGRERPEGQSPVHVDAAAFAALCAMRHWKPGIFNIAEEGGAVATRKAVELLQWRADFRLGPVVAFQ
jgi:nucleoside-diphosphate-sugar epimerase